MICPDCNGSGQAGCITMMPDGDDFYDDCPTCGGEGEIECAECGGELEHCILCGLNYCVGCSGLHECPQEV